MNHGTDEERLARCFLAVFPQLAREGIASADRENIPGWDSLTGVTLISVIEEEFGVELDPAILEDSKFAFISILACVAKA